MNFNFIVPQSPAGAVPALYCVPPNVTKSHTTSFSFLHPKFKTEMCNKYDPMLGCPYGEQCQFRHPEDPHPTQPSAKPVPVTMGRSGGRFVNRPPNLNNDFRRRNPSFSSQYSNGRQGRSPTTPLSYIHPKFKTEMCNKYDSVFGCPYGEQCQFRHPEDPHPSQIVMKKISQITISDNGTMSNVPPSFTTAPLSLPMAGRGGGRFFGRSNVAGDFRRRNTSFNSQPFNKGKLQYQNTKYTASNPKANKMSQNHEFLNNATLPFFLKLAGKAPKNGMRRYNSQDTLGHFTYSRVAALKKRLSPVTYSTAQKL